MEIAVAGDSGFVTGFRLTGVRKIYEVLNQKELILRIEECLEDRELGIFVLKLDDYEKLPFRLKRRLDESHMPTVMLIGGTAFGLKEKIKRAIGVDLWK
ncbi:MAG: V-type ATP synthase subunit F [Candidatus Methanofastidiosia archaeon]